MRILELLFNCASRVFGFWPANHLMKHSVCDFPMMSAEECSGLIANKLESRVPFSLIRLGDGEGVLLSISKNIPDIDLEYLAMHLGPEEVSPEGVLSLKMRMQEAIVGSDVIGVRDDIVGVKFDQKNFDLSPERFLENFRERFKLRDCEKNLPYKGSRRIALLHKNLSEMYFDVETRFCSSWVHYDLHLSGSIFKCMMSEKEIGLITSRPELSSRLQTIFDVKVDCWLIPDMYRDLDHENSHKDYIKQLENILQQQLVKFPGMLFLVGGGFYGKLYCNLIKSQGGIALDVGSLLDAWAGVHSRPAVYKTLFSASYDANVAPRELLLSVENVRRLVESV